MGGGWLGLGQAGWLGGQAGWLGGVLRRRARSAGRGAQPAAVQARRVQAAALGEIQLSNRRVEWRLWDVLAWGAVQEPEMDKRVFVRNIKPEFYKCL